MSAKANRKAQPLFPAATSSPKASSTVVRAAIQRLLRVLLPRRVFEWLQVRRYRWQVAHYKSREVTRTHGGFDLRLHIADKLGEKWYDRDVPSKPEIDFLRSFRLLRGACVFNLGAHQAIHSIILAKIVGPSGLVVAVEPSPHNVAVGERNRVLNDVGQLRLLQAAASDRSSTLVISERLNAEVREELKNGFGAIAVQSLSVDDLSREYGLPDVMFVDVEGFECRVLRGARRTLEACPDWFIEVHPPAIATYGGSVPELLSYFDDRDYELFVAQDRDGSPEGTQFTRFRPRLDKLPPPARWFLVATSIRPAD